MKLLYIISFVFLSIGVIFLIGVTPEESGDDVSNFLLKKKTLRSLQNEIKQKKQLFLLKELERLRKILFQMGNEKRFNVCCYMSIIMIVVGISISYFFENIIFYFVIPALLAAIPFVIVKAMVSSYEKRIREDLETSLSIITSSYTRSLDIVAAVEENLTYLRPPIKDMFSSFLIETTMISSNLGVSLDNLKSKIDNDVFKEWCEIIKDCQKDKSLVDMLLPTVSKLTDIRIVNNDLKTILIGARKEYFFMVMLVFLNFPIIYFLNREWFSILVDTIPGKIVVGTTLIVCLVTSVLMFRFTKPIEYRK